MAGLREQKKRDLRSRLSTMATAMFLERGFEAVSVAEVAAAAGVSKMTVFNYFPRKEDLFFDRVPDLVEALTRAVRERALGVSPVGAVGALLLHFIDTRSAFSGLTEGVAPYWAVATASPALRARLHEQGEEAEALLTRLLAEADGTDPESPDARLRGALVTAAARVCVATAVRRQIAGEAPASFAAAHRAFVAETFAHLDGAFPPQGGATCRAR